MADIELVIKIPEGLKKDFELEQWTALSCMEMKNALMNSTPLPKGHGDLKDADAIKDVIYKYFEDIQFYDGTGYDIYSDSKENIDKIPTIIEADKEQEE